MAKSSLELIVKFGSSLLVSTIKFTVKTFTAETQTQQNLVATLNSTHHVVHIHVCAAMCK